MPYVVPTTFTAGSVLTAAQMNVIGSDLVDHESRLLTMGSKLVKSTAFSAVASVTITSCFSATYTNYLVTLDATYSTTNTASWQLVSGSTPAATNYLYVDLYSDGSTGPTRNVQSAATNTCPVSGSTGTITQSILVTKPFVATNTGFVYHGSGFTSTAGSYYLQFGGSNHAAATSYDGFKLAVSSGTTTGTIRVYGLLDS